MDFRVPFGSEAFLHHLCLTNTDVDGALSIQALRPPVHTIDGGPIVQA
jgi:hypothetical protein